MLFIERCEMLSILSSHIKKKDRIHTHCSIQSYQETEKGVSVTTNDGQVVHGSILVGADGIHSHVRGLMADVISKTDPVLAKELRTGRAPLVHNSGQTTHSMVQASLRSTNVSLAYPATGPIRLSCQTRRRTPSTMITTLY